MVKAIMMDGRDNVATLLADAEVGVKVEITSRDGETEGEVNAKQRIPFGHKISLSELGAGQKVIKYGEVIGETTAKIGKGEHVHVHNLRSITWGKFG